MTNQSHGGFALPLVLIVLALLTVLSMGLSRLVSMDMDFLRERISVWEYELEISNATESIVFVLLTGEYGYQSVGNGEVELPLNGRPAEINGQRVWIQSWSGLYSMALLGVNRLEGVLGELTNSQRARQISAELADWVDEDDRRRFRGRERADYANEGLRQRPRNAPIRGVDELLELPSVSVRLMNGSDGKPGLADLILAGGEDNFDVGTAPDVLIGPVLGLPEPITRELIAARSDGQWSKVLFLIDQNHWSFNHHPPFYKGQKYRMDFQSDRGVTARVEIELKPYATRRLYHLIEWQVPYREYE